MGSSHSFSFATAKVSNEHKQILYHENFIMQGNSWFFQLLRISGIFPMSINRQGRLSYKFLSLSNLYTLLIVVMNIAVSSMLTRTVIYNLLSKNFSFVDGFLYSTFLTCGAIHLTPAISFFEAKKMEEFMNDWAIFQARFEQTTNKKLKICGFRQFLCLIAMYIAFATCLFAGGMAHFDSVYYKYGLNKGFHDCLIFLSSYCINVIGCYLYIWFSFSRALKYAAERIVFNVEDFAYLDGKLIEEQFQLWLHLRLLCMGLGRVFCYSYTYLCVIMFLASLVSIFSATSGQLIDSSMQLVPVVSTLFFISILAEIGQRSTDSVSNEVENRLTRFLISGRAKKCEKELTKFIDSVGSLHANVSLAGYFNLNRSINAPLYSSVITYLVIIMQFGEKKS